MHTPSPRYWLFFTASTLIAATLAFGAVLLLKDVVIPQVKPEILTVVGGPSENDDEARLRSVRERVLTAVFPIVRRAVDGTTTKATSVALGLTADGYLLTTLPLAADALFMLPGNITVPAKEIIKDETLGIAIVKVEAVKLPVIRFGESKFIEPGTSMHALAPMLIEAGTIVAHAATDDRRVVGATELTRRFRVSGDFSLPGSPIASGDTVLAMVVDPAKHLALPSDSLSLMIARFLKTKRIQHPALAIDIELLERGALVKQVRRATNAEKSGLKIGDVILKVEGESVQPSRHLAELLETYDPSATVEMTILRAGNEIKISIPLSETAKK